MSDIQESIDSVVVAPEKLSDLAQNAASVGFASLSLCRVSRETPTVDSLKRHTIHPDDEKPVSWLAFVIHPDGGGFSDSHRLAACQFYADRQNREG